MKAIMISIKPKYVAKILNGEKTIEIRKTMPKCDLPIEVYIYCTKDNHQMMKQFGEYHFNKNIGGYCGFNGKVVAKFTLNKVGIIHDFLNGLEETEPSNRHITISTQDELLSSSCLTEEELRTYGGKYAIHISDLEIFDKPKELSKFRKCYRSKGYPQNQSWYLTKAPQSWCYVEDLK